MPAPPLLGYNNNVRHRGRIFHIQTEDSGVGSPRIMTHLFADGGRIVKSTRTDYSEHVGRPEMVEVVKNMMKDQHKAMFVALRSGQLDEIIGFDFDEPPPSLALGTLSGTESAPLSLSGSPTSGTQSSASPQSSSGTQSSASPQGSSSPRAATAAGTSSGASSSTATSGSSGTPSSSGTPAVSETQASSGAGASSARGASPPSSHQAPPSSGVPSSTQRTPRPARPETTPAAAVPSPSAAAGKGGTPSERPYAAPRPAAIFSVPPSGSIFGDVGIDEKSLDDAILSYLAEDPKKKD